METKQIILDTLKKLGFELKMMDGLGYGFIYEGRRYVYSPNESDDEFLSIALPFVEEYNEEDSKVFYQLMDKLNAERKYVKAYKVDDGMWLFYERELGENEDYEKLLQRMIIQLDVALYFLHKFKDELDGIDGGATEIDDDDDDDDSNHDEDAA